MVGMVALYLALVCGIIGASFAFAWFGEPQSLWLWRDVLGVL